MEIERINDSTLKFFITYNDIEDRGFDRDEIWYNRERGEELLFEMMNEAHDQENFEIEGPLWIQVQALDRGLEMVVTRGQVSDGNVKLEIPVQEQSGEEQPVDDNIVDLLDQQFRRNDQEKDRQKKQNDGELEIVFSFTDIEDVIALSQAVTLEGIHNELHHFEGRYYLYARFDESFKENEQDNIVSRVLEYGDESDVSVHRIREYGSTVANETALKTFYTYFAV
ncbi:adapter protein MecA 1/2 [Salsuginibacillus halophilus]|uniref:Adapter protein MecA n=1 Tax=Salsuginibacillus halophilus TaxID=517424 RepID=A0A2P8HXP3_9BACI|nr:adaptor protein MecA [Salsuginibacillus halophilus]PSL50915.1 adapter protein MecA 1/2 [Salsuginibacillus halophilus]